MLGILLLSAQTYSAPTPGRPASSRTPILANQWGPTALEEHFEDRARHRRHIEAREGQLAIVAPRDGLGLLLRPLQQLLCARVRLGELSHGALGPIRELRQLAVGQQTVEVLGVNRPDFQVVSNRSLPATLLLPTGPRQRIPVSMPKGRTWLLGLGPGFHPFPLPTPGPACPACGTPGLAGGWVHPPRRSGRTWNDVSPCPCGPPMPQDCGRHLTKGTHSAYGATNDMMRTHRQLRYHASGLVSVLVNCAEAQRLHVITYTKLT